MPNHGRRTTPLEANQKRVATATGDKEKSGQRETRDTVRYQSLVLGEPLMWKKRKMKLENQVVRNRPKKAESRIPPNFLAILGKGNRGGLSGAKVKFSSQKDRKISPSAPDNPTDAANQLEKK